MKQQKYNEGNFGTKLQKQSKSGQRSKTRQAVKFRSCENSQHFKISVMLTLPLYLAPNAFFFVHAASSLARVLRI